MTTEKKNGITLSAGNWITIGVFLVTGITAWAKIQMHISDETIHLTEEQRRNLTEFTTIVDDKLPLINSNQHRIIDIEKDFAVFKTNYINLHDEHENLENKVSRNYIELRNKIEGIEKD